MALVKKDLAPGITVYRPVFKDLSNTLDIIKKSTNVYTPLLNIDPKSKINYPNTTYQWQRKHTREDEDQIMTAMISKNLEHLRSNGFENHEEILTMEEIEQLYKACFEDYIKNNKNKKIFYPYIKDYTYPSNDHEWLDLDFSLHKHKLQDPLNYPLLWESEKNNTINQFDEKILGWHFDEYIWENTYHHRSIVTGNLYLNDKYKSGRVMFLYGNDFDNFKKFDNLNIIAYKPMAGDIVLYPSFWPVAHAVTAPFNEDRYFVSKIWKYWHNVNDLDDNFIEYSKYLYENIHLYAKDVPQERMKTVTGEELWSKISE